MRGLLLGLTHITLRRFNCLSTPSDRGAPKRTDLPWKKLTGSLKRMTFHRLEP